MFETKAPVCKALLCLSLGTLYVQVTPKIADGAEHSPIYLFVHVK